MYNNERLFPGKFWNKQSSYVWDTRSTRLKINDTQNYFIW
jgi:hypothetical protein